MSWSEASKAQLTVLLLKFDEIQLQISGLVFENRDLRHGRTGHG